MKNKVKIQFLGAAGTVTGSKYYIETSSLKILIDCGLFQGLKELRNHNWEDLPIDVAQLDYVLLTHGHLDHTGYLPRLIQQGFTGSILGNAPSLAIAEIILKDTAKIQEEEAERANKKSYSKHHPALPLYTDEDVMETLRLFKTTDVNTWIELAPNIRFKLRKAGHILGACFIELEIYEKIFVFSGDLGRENDLLLPPPEKPKWADYLFLESTYGKKLHPQTDATETLIELINTTIQNSSNLIMASFAVERLQLLIYILWELYKKNKIPRLPIYVDSPMGIDVTHLFSRFPADHKIPEHEFQAMKNHIELVSSYKRTWEIIDKPGPKIVIAGSGMMTGGRILTYLKQYSDDSENIFVLTGYQAEGTRGRQLEEGAYEVKIHGKYFPFNARIVRLESLSAHADQAELINWCRSIKNVPEQVFLVHGERQVTDAFRVKLQTEFNWHIKLPTLFEEIEISL
ncbi:MBL fold metallo-hydrolase RNA specificity domain-containing protein [Christiangramia salexigens]|uniref:MBL fold metallo-hydrolase n=1 Tax=Christiangramia salexigens TaxID=1913577 RepID=A0A1L3J1W1_9FLAO|nr:MBL fold metallo-hydrolase [Christiangramia salexigens]APG59132.1 MBL fold metallo-hydrolase [Christiangramia salexigens]